MAIVLYVQMAFFAMGMITDQDKFNHRNFTIAFVVCVIAATILNLIGG